MSHPTSHSDVCHATLEWQRQRRLFHAVNRAATVLLAASEEKFADSLQESMELMGRCVDVDRVLLWQSEVIDGGLYYVNRYQWFNDNGCQGIPIPENSRFFCHDQLEWESKFLRNECINGPLSTLTQRARDLLRPYSIQSVLLIPLFLQEQFWGIFGFADCHQERTFTEDEIDILHSAGLMIVSAINRIAQAADIREAHKQMMKEIERRDHLLDIGNRAATVLLAIEDEKDLEASILKGMELVGRCVDVDRVLIRRNEIIDGELYYVKKYEWLNNDDSQVKTPLLSAKTAYLVDPEWKRKFLRNECINGPASTLSQYDQEVLRPFGIKSILAIPLFLQDQFWGVASFGDCRQERTFTEDEVNILRSIGFMLVSAINRSAQAADIREVHERMKLMLDAVPLSCHLWDRNFKLFACNKENLHLFKPKDLQYLLDRFYEFSPEFQPDGRRSSEASVAYIQQAFEEGRCVFEWIHQTLDGTPLPTEVTLVRVLYGDDYVVAGYVRDLREHKQMMEEIERRGNLMSIGNRAATILLAMEDEKDLETSILKGMELVGRCADVDRVFFWQNEMIDGELYHVNKYEWLSNKVQQVKSLPQKTKRAYRDNPEWKSKFLRNECINGPTSTLTQRVQEVLHSFHIKSILAIPLFLQDQFWGFASFADCRRERTFTEDEVNILRTIGFMLISANNRAVQAADIREVHERMKLMLDAVPLSCHLWDRNFKLFACNKENLHLFKPKDLQYLLDRFYDFSPEYQPDGRLSSEAAVACLQRAFDEGRYVFEWMHQTQDGTPIPTEVTLVRVLYGDDYVVAGYVRDLREHKQMMEEIERQDHLLKTVNQAATILLKSEIDEFEHDLQDCLGMIGEAVGVDRVRIWKNHTIDGRLHCTQAYEWSGGAAPQQGNEITIDVSFDDCIPGWKETLGQRECIHRLVRDMSPAEQKQVASQGVLAVLLVPMFLRDHFWGFIGYDDCHRELLFTENEQTVLRSGGLLISNALLRYSMMQDIRDNAEQLESALEEAREANHIKSDFLARMSHEMRTPLNAVIGFSELTLDIDGLHEDAFSNIEKIHNAGTTLLSTVNDILDISKIEAGKLDLVPHEYDIPSLINDTITQTILRVEDKPIRFVLDIHESLPVRLYGDELRIRQIFNNLLSNAFKYTREGTVEFGIRCDREGDTVVMTAWVRDTGIGIKAEDLNRLFTDYTRMDKKSNRQIEGTGLGLTIAKRLAEMMNGSVTVESEYGKGSLFTVKFHQKFVSDATIGPELVESLKGMRYSDNKREQNSRLERIKLPYARVLVVDDLPTNLDVAKGMLKPYGMQIDCVTSGQQAIDAIREEKVRYNAIFMDQMMPDKDGIETTRIIRQEIGTEYAKTIPIIALTANAIVGAEQIFLSKGFQAFISKPIETSALDAVVRQWVQNKTLEEKWEDQPEEIKRLRCPWRLNGVDLQRGWERFGCDEESFLYVLRSYAFGTSPFLEKIREVNGDNLAHYAVTIHGIKGSSAGIYANKVADMAEALETAAKAGDLDFVQANNPAFLNTAFELVTNLKEMLDKIAAEKAKPKKDKLEEKVLARLLTACENYDIDEIDAAITELESHAYESNAELVVWLRENVNQMNYVQVREKLESRVESAPEGQERKTV